MQKYLHFPNTKYSYDIICKLVIGKGLAIKEIKTFLKSKKEKKSFAGR